MRYQLFDIFNIFIHLCFMINGKRIKELYESLDLERKAELRELVFRNSRQSFNYFDRRKNITFTKVEIIADYFGISMDSLRMKNEEDEIPVATFGRQKGSSNVEMLKEQVQNLKTITESQKDLIDSLKEVIKMKDEKIELLQNADR